MQRALRGDGGTDVPCGTCTACCTSSQFVHIEPDETDTLAHIPADVLFPAPLAPRGHVLLGYDERGHCPMLVDNACSIYEHRPRVSHLRLPDLPRRGCRAGGRRQGRHHPPCPALAVRVRRARRPDSPRRRPRGRVVSSGARGGARRRRSRDERDEGRRDRSPSARGVLGSRRRGGRRGGRRSGRRRRARRDRAPNRTDARDLSDVERLRLSRRCSPTGAVRGTLPSPRGEIG